jgi:quercetin dioxygenase-like cupin family protein
MENGRGKLAAQIFVLLPTILNPQVEAHVSISTLGGIGVFQIGSAEVEVSAGQIIVVPANTPHKFKNLGPGPFSSIDIHENGEFATEWLEDF